MSSPCDALLYPAWPLVYGASVAEEELGDSRQPQFNISPFRRGTMEQPPCTNARLQLENIFDGKVGIPGAQGPVMPSWAVSSRWGDRGLP